MSGSEQLKEVLSGYRNKRASVRRDIEMRKEWIQRDEAEIEVLDLLITQIDNLINQRESDEHKSNIS